MALKIRPVQASALDLSVTPYVGTTLWKEGVHLFHAWVCQTFTKTPVPDFVVAETLDVHRTIADIWIMGMHELGLVDDYCFWSGDIHVSAFNIKERVKAKVSINVGELRDYDPWEHRDFDKDLPDARFPDYFIDKYYDVFINEYFLVYRKMRKRPNGKFFQPLDLTEHPRYAENSAKANRDHTRQADPEWRDLIDTTACV